MLVDRPTDIGPLSGDSQVGLIDEPQIPRNAAALPGRLYELRSEPLDPAADNDVIDSDATLGQQLLGVAVGEARRYQRTATEITSRGNRKPAKTEAVQGQSPASHDRPTQQCHPPRRVGSGGTDGRQARSAGMDSSPAPGNVNLRGRQGLKSTTTVLDQVVLAVTGGCKWS